MLLQVLGSNPRRLKPVLAVQTGVIPVQVRNHEVGNMRLKKASGFNA